MFQLKYARIHYGVRSYEMNNLPAKFRTLESPEDVQPDELRDYVGRAYGYPRDFTVRHQLAMDMEVGEGHPPIHIDEHVVASANGYSFIWWRV